VYDGQLPLRMRPSSSAVGVLVLAMMVAVMAGFTLMRDPAPPTSVSPAPTTSARLPTPTGTTAEPTRTTAELTVVGVGDSVIYEAGSWYRQAVAGGQVDRLVSAGNFGVPGATTARIMNEPLTRALAKRPDVVLIGGGTNDMLSAVPLITTVANLQVMVATVKAAGAKPVLETVPPSNEGVFVGRLNDAIRSLAKSEGVPLLDLFAVVGTDSGRYRDGMTTDLRHPNPTGYAVMTAEAVRQLTALRLTV
jgi:lysophospholipase L1-like esterase